MVDLERIEAQMRDGYGFPWVDTVRGLVDEVRALRAERDALNESADALSDRWDGLVAERDALKAELEGLKLDVSIAQRFYGGDVDTPPIPPHERGCSGCSHCFQRGYRDGHKSTQTDRDALRAELDKLRAKLPEAGHD